MPKDKPNTDSNDYPWNSSTLIGWSICGMSHYCVGGKKKISVSMTKDHKCIEAEGEDDARIWLRLEKHAKAI